MDPDLMTDEQLADRARVGIVTCQHCGMPTRVDLESELAQCREALAAFRAFVETWDDVEHKLGFCLSFTREKQFREARAAVEPYMTEGE
jgi:hypothetical protein